MIDRLDPLTIHVVCFRLDTRSYVQPQESKTVSDDDLKKLGATLRDGLQQTITNILKVSPGSEDCSSIPLISWSKIPWWHLLRITFFEWSPPHICCDILFDTLSGIYFDILSDILFCICSGIYSDILSGINSHILSGIYSDIFSGINSHILSDILSDILSGILLGIYSDIFFWHKFSHSFWHSLWHSFWHSTWHLFWHSSVWLRSGSAHWDLERLRTSSAHWELDFAVEEAEVQVEAEGGMQLW